MYFGSFVVSHSLLDFLAGLFHLGLVFSVHSVRLSMRAKSSWSLLSIVSSLRAAVTAVCCSSISAPSFAIAAAVAACFCPSLTATCFAAAVALVACCCPSISASSFAAADVVVVCCRSSISDSSCVAAAVFIVCCRSSISDSSCAVAACLPVTLFPSSTYLHSISWSFSDESGSSRGFLDVEYLASLVFLNRFCSCFLFSKPPFLFRMGIELRSYRSVVTLQVSHVVYLGIGTVFSASFVNQDTVQLFIFPTGRSEGSLFFLKFLECCIESHIVLDHRPPLHPDPSFAGLSRFVFSNVVSFRVYSKSKQSVEVSRDEF